MKTLADNLRDRMAKLRINQVDLASRISTTGGSVTQAYLSQILSGKRKNPRPETLAQIARAIDCQPGDLLEESTPLAPTSKAAVRQMVSINERAQSEAAYKDWFAAHGASLSWQDGKFLDGLAASFVDFLRPEELTKALDVAYEQLRKR